MPPPLRVLTADDREGPPAPPGSASSWQREREQLLALLTQQQRVAQAGLLTAGLTHDVNNHLTVISGSAFLALRSRKPDEWREALEQIQEHCLAAAGLTRTFLDFVKRQDVVGQRTFSLSDVVTQASRLMRPLARSRQVELVGVVEEDGRVTGEVRLAVQAVVNLVSNAIRACAATQGRVEIHASRPDGTRCRLTVSDDGPGIPEALRRSIFRPLVTDGGGNGLGLFIVRQNVRSMNGTIRLRTSPGGATFTIDLPGS